MNSPQVMKAAAELKRDVERTLAISPGDKMRVTGYGDLMMDRDLGKHIGELVEIVRQRKDGLYEVQTVDGKKAFARRNLDRYYG